MIDEELTAVFSRADFRAALHDRRRLLRQAATDALGVAAHGGLFTVTRELCGFVDLLIRQGKTSAVLIDDRQNPVPVPDLAAFLDDLLKTYAAATENFSAEWEKLRHARSAADVAGA